MCLFFAGVGNSLGSLFSLYGLSFLRSSLGVSMSSATVPSLPDPAPEDARGSWASCGALRRFTWAVRRCGLSSSVLHAVPRRSALAVWLCNLDLWSWVEEVPPGVLNADDGMLDWIVSSVKSGNTPKEVLVWIFPSFEGHFFDLIKGGGLNVGSMQCYL